MAGLGNALGDLSRYPSAVVGLVLIVCLVGISVYMVAFLPHDDSIRLFRVERTDKYQLPELAQPAWVNLFRRSKLPETLLLSTMEGARGRQAATPATGWAGSESRPNRSSTVAKVVTPLSEDTQEVSISFTFDYPYGVFPQDLELRFIADYQEKMPFVDSLLWITPDGREMELGRFATPTKSHPFFWLLVTRGENLSGGQGGPPAMHMLFADPSAATPVPLEGTYRLRIGGFTFENGSTLEAELVILGRVYGLAGTDNERSDLRARAGQAG